MNNDRLEELIEHYCRRDRPKQCNAAETCKELIIALLEQKAETRRWQYEKLDDCETCQYPLVNQELEDRLEAVEPRPRKIDMPFGY